ncbi:hypothetical protein CDAR_105821 [Caerostris darwini]|uniref:Uncharacterized protein n=1 Tax=Caerostris darwini TaxID=1538125 RepID=A0AAV4TSD0_9ARAC|nr:hypothetical protein CDAR_105821 [Caerostris darwini]
MSLGLIYLGRNTLTNDHLRELRTDHLRESEILEKSQNELTNHYLGKSRNELRNLYLKKSRNELTNLYLEKSRNFPSSNNVLNCKCTMLFIKKIEYRAILSKQFTTFYQVKAKSTGLSSEILEPSKLE